MDNIITAVDIGSSKIKTIIGRFTDDKKENFQILGVGIAYSNALRKGNILDMEEFKNNIDKSLEEAEKMSGEQVAGVFLSFNSSNMDIIDGKGIITVSGEEVTYSDIDRVLDMARSGVDMPNRDILKVIPDVFTVDLEAGIKSPIGMAARKLEVRATIFSVANSTLSNIKKAITDVGVEVYDVYPNVIVAPEGVLTKRQKELGVVCIDIGATTTGLTVYEEGTLKYASIIPIGGENVTNDVALGVRTSIDVAEKLKMEYGFIHSSDIEDLKDTEIPLSKISKFEEAVVSQKYLSQIITARYEEIFYFVKEELRKIGKDGMLPEGAVLVGGGAKAKGVVELSKEMLRLPTSIGIPSERDNIGEASVSDPIFSSVLGNMIMANRYTFDKAINISFGGIWGSIHKVIKKLLP